MAGKYGHQSIQIMLGIILEEFLALFQTKLLATGYQNYPLDKAGLERIL